MSESIPRDHVLKIIQKLRSMPSMSSEEFDKGWVEACKEIATEVEMYPGTEYLVPLYLIEDAQVS